MYLPRDTSMGRQYLGPPELEHDSLPGCFWVPDGPHAYFLLQDPYCTQTSFHMFHWQSGITEGIFKIGLHTDTAGAPGKAQDELMSGLSLFPWRCHYRKSDSKPWHDIGAA